MALFSNEHGEFYNPADYEPPRNPFAKYAELRPVMHGYDAPRRAIEFDEKRCEICGRKYRPAAAHQRYCSKECRDASRRVGDGGKMPKEATCPACGKVFAPKVHNQRYCSKECRKSAENGKRRVRYRMCRSLTATLVVVAMLPFTAFGNAHDTDEPLEVMDLPMRVEVASGEMSHGTALLVEPQAPETTDEQETGFAAEYPDAAIAADYDEPDYPPTDGYQGYVAEYNPLYNTDGPSHEMPGWHDGYLETYFNASAHYRAGEWTVDSEGFYRDGDYYVVGVDIADTNPNTGEPYRIGDVVETGKGSAVVMDYGSGARVHDFAVVW